MESATPGNPRSVTPAFHRTPDVELLGHSVECAPSVWDLEKGLVLFVFPMAPSPEGIRSGLFKYELTRMRDLAMAIYPARIKLPQPCKLATVTVLTEQPEPWQMVRGKQAPKAQLRRGLEAMVAEVFGANEVLSHVRQGRCLAYVRLCAGRSPRAVGPLPLGHQ